MLASFLLAEKRLPGRARNEGRRVLRNTATIGAFLASPLHLFLMVRALGRDGYGRWWWTFVLLEAATIVGVVGTDLYVRKELPLCEDDEPGRLRAVATVGTSLAIVTVTGVSLALLQIALAGPLASLQGDPELRPFMVLLAFQPLTWSLGTVLSAALQSRSHLGALAFVRGIVIPLMVAVVFYVAWRAELPVATTLALMLANSVLAVGIILALYARHFPLGATLRAAMRPTLLRPALANGMRLFVPVVLYTIGGKLDLYIVGAYYEPAYVGLYAACLQVASLVPNVRGLFEPIVQAQIGGLYSTHRPALGASLRHLARLCAFAIAPAFVLTVAVGQPILGWLVGTNAPQTFEPLVVLAVGHVVMSISLAAWIVPMMFQGRVLAVIAATAGIVKLGLLLLLVPRHGAIGAALAASVGGIVAYYGQTWFGVREVGFQPFPRSIVPVVFAMLAVAAAGRALYHVVAPRMTELPAVAVTSAASLALLALVLFLLMDASDRLELRKLVGLRPPSVTSGT